MTSISSVMPRGMLASNVGVLAQYLAEPWFSCKRPKRARADVAKATQAIRNTYNEHALRNTRHSRYSPARWVT
jgi:hypothetical protein